MNGMVYVSMYYPDGRVVFEKLATTVRNDVYEFSTIPIIEANEPTTFTIRVEDIFGNSSTKELVLEKIDSKVPELTASTDSNSGEWAKRRKFTFTATDNGVGEVSFAFNTQINYELGNYAEGVYTKEYTFVGDTSEVKTAIIYLKDGLGNLVSKKVTIGKIDSESPNITNVTQEKVEKGTRISIEANDIGSKTGKAGSGIAGYVVTRSKQTPSANSYTADNHFLIEKAGTYYIWVKDKAGNVSQRQEIIVL